LLWGRNNCRLERERTSDAQQKSDV
jgi:hypothetical protein